MKFNNILIVEDETIATQYLKYILESLEVSSIFVAKNANDAENIIKMVKLDLAFMDINIQGSVDGIECAKLLNQFYFLPIIFTTAHNDSYTIRETSKTNVFGYLTKPFDEKDVEIVLSIASRLLKHKTTSNTTPLENKVFIILNEKYSYDINTNTLLMNNNPIKLTKKEMEVVYLFCTNLNKNISYEYLKEYVWNAKDISNSTIRDTVSRLKKKLEGLNIENLINFGYILKI